MLVMFDTARGPLFIIQYGPDVIHENEFAKHDVNLALFYMPWRSETVLLVRKKKRWININYIPFVLICIHM